MVGKMEGKFYNYKSRVKDFFSGKKTPTKWQGKEPLHECVMKRFLSRSIISGRQLFGALGLSFFLSTAGAGLTSCSENDTDVREVIVNRSGLTDENGLIAFEVDGRRHELIVSDYENGEPVHNMAVMLSTKNGFGTYLALDPEGRYTARMLGANITSENESENSFDAIVTKLRTHPCTDFVNFFTQSRAPNQLFEEAYLPEEQSMLKQNFYPVRTNVPLSEMDDEITQLIEFASSRLVDEGMDAASARVTVILGIKIGSASRLAFEGLGFGLIISDICTTLETREWGDYYRSLCYEDDAKFEIWKLKNIPELGFDIEGIQIGILSNPILVVIPMRGDALPSWQAPVGIISGQVEVQEGDYNGNTPLVILEPQEEGFPRFATTVRSWPGPFRFGDFSAVISACDGYNFGYEVGVQTNNPDYGDPVTSLIVENENEYSISYIINRFGIGGEYETFFSQNEEGICDTHDRIVTRGDASIGYVEEGLCLGSCEGNSEETWISTYEFRGQFNSVVQADDGGFVVTGEMGDALDHQIIASINNEGCIEWIYRSEGNERFERAIEISGGFLVFGYRIVDSDDTGLDVGNAYAIKLAHDGEVIWEREIDIEYHDRIIDGRETSDRGLILTGEIIENLNDYTNGGISLIRLDENGTLIWANRIDDHEEHNGINPDYSSILGNSVYEVEGGYLIGGSWYARGLSSNLDDMIFVRADESGNELWSEIDGGIYLGRARRMIRMDDGTFLIIAAPQYLVNATYYDDLSIIGDLWIRGGDFDVGGRFIDGFRTPDDGLVILQEEALLRLNREAEVLWQRELSLFGVDQHIRSIAATADGGFVLVGNTDLTEVEMRPLFIKTNHDGEVE